MSTHTLFCFIWEPPPIPRRALPGSVPANGVSQSSMTLFCTGLFLRAAGSQDGQCRHRGTVGHNRVGQPVPGHKSVCPGAKGPVWRLREPVDGAGSVSGCDTAWQRGSGIPELMGFPSCPCQGPWRSHQHFTKAHFISLFSKQEETSPTLHQSWTEDPTR